MATTVLRGLPEEDHDAATGLRSAASAEALLLDVVARHAAELLGVARAHSICADDAHDAYQRSLELFLRHGRRLRTETAHGWLFTVVKREAQALRRSRTEHVVWEEMDAERVEARHDASPEDRVLAGDVVARSAEALQGLKPAELRALWLRASGHSYAEIQTSTGWTHTKVNRSLAEGRRAFLTRYAQIEQGAECRRWAQTLAAVAAGQARPGERRALRPHLRNCPGCKTTLRELRATAPPLAVVLPPVLLAPAGARGSALLERLGAWLSRLAELAGGQAEERSLAAATRVQAALETASTGKLAVVATSAATLAGGGAVVAGHAAPPPGRHAAPVARAVARAGAPTVVGRRGAASATVALAGRAPRPALPAGSARGAAPQVPARRSPIAPARREFGAAASPDPGEFTVVAPPRKRSARSGPGNASAARAEFAGPPTPSAGAGAWEPARGAMAPAPAAPRQRPSQGATPAAVAEFGP